MKNQYQGKINGFELSPLDNNCARLKVSVFIPRLEENIELNEEGLLTFLEEKYPFIRDSYTRSMPLHREKICMVEKDENNDFQFVAYFTINAVN